MPRFNPLRNVTNVRWSKGERAKPSRSEKAHPPQLAADNAREPDEDRTSVMQYDEYRASSIRYFKANEIRFLPSPDYILNQDELKWSMRSVLIDWLIDVHWKLNLVQETLFLCINIVDRFLSASNGVAANRLQLVGIAALFIASKYEEVSWPSIDTFTIISHDTFTQNDIINAERYMLSVLNFQIEFPSPVTFVKLCMHTDDGFDPVMSRYTMYILERMSLDESFIKYPGSIKSCCSVVLVKKILRSDDNIENVPKIIGYRMEDIVKCTMEVNEMMMVGSIYKNVENKYSDIANFVAEYFTKNRLARKHI